MSDPPFGQSPGNRTNNRTASGAKRHKLDEDSTSLLVNVDPENAYDGIGFWHDPCVDGDNDNGEH